MKQAIGENKVLKSWKAAAAVLNNEKGWEVFVYFILFYLIFSMWSDILSTISQSTQKERK